jgi:hypothetical protein
MKDVVHFRWVGSDEREDGVAVYEIGRSTYSIGLPDLLAANELHMVLSEVYRKAYDSGARSTKVAVKSALSKILE